MKLGYTIVYVPRVADSLQFFEQAFGLERKFLHDSGDYGELKTGETTLAFASHALGAMNFPAGHVQASESHQPLGMEIAFVTEDVQHAHLSAIKHGAKELRAKQSLMSALRTVPSSSYAPLLAGERYCLTPRST